MIHGGALKPRMQVVWAGRVYIWSSGHWPPQIQGHLDLNSLRRLLGVPADVCLCHRAVWSQFPVTAPPITVVPEVGLFLVSLRPEPGALGVLRSVRMASCGPPSTTGPGLVSAFYVSMRITSRPYSPSAPPPALRLWPPYFLLSWYLFALNKIFSALLFLSER